MTTAEKGKKNGWWLARAAALEGACRLAGLCCRLGGLYLAYARMTGYLAVGWTDSLPGALCGGCCRRPCCRGCCFPPCGCAARRFMPGCRQSVCRRLAAVGCCGGVALAALVAAHSGADGGSGPGGCRVEPRRSPWSEWPGETLPWLLLGAAAGLLGAVAVAVWQCRYAVAPLLVLQGCPAGAAMGFSAQAMRRHIGEYLNLLGSWALPLASCLLVVPAVWVLPRFGAARTAWLCGAGSHRQGCIRAAPG